MKEINFHKNKTINIYVYKINVFSNKAFINAVVFNEFINQAVPFFIVNFLFVIFREFSFINLFGQYMI